MERAGVLSIRRVSSRVVSRVSGEVARPQMTSTSFITGTGFMKCMPITLSGRLVLAAMRPMGMDEVLEARMTCGGQTSSRVWKILNLIASFSLAASTT